MAISPPSDIVLDVARAADPLQYTAAAEKLARISRSGAAAAADFESLFATTDTASSSGEAAPEPFRGDLRSRLSVALASGSPPPAPYRQFEAFVLQNFIQSMLPKDAPNVYGQGIAGDFWSSMLAEQIAKQIAEAGGVGIAVSIEAKHPATGAPIPGAGALVPSSSATGNVVAYATVPGVVGSLERSFVDGLSSDDDGGVSSDAGLY